MSRPDPAEGAREGAAPPSDAALLAAVAHGQLGALGELFDRHHDAVRKFLRRTHARVDDVDDLVQETFLTASRAASSFDGSPSARPFLLGIAAQLVRRQRRTFARLHRLIGALTDAVAPPRPSPEDHAAAASQRSKLERAILSLPEDLRIVLVMVEANELSGVEVAKVLGVPPGTVWRRLHDARARLKRLLSDEAEDA